MDEIEVRNTELCYVTSVDRMTRTFFAQLCKYSNEELILLNHLINEHCSKVVANQATKPAPKKLHKGDIICARFLTDGRWYRALVLSRDKVKQVCSVLFVDYGNLETISYDDLVQVDRTVLSVMGRAPFGITCILKDSENYNQEDSELLLDCLTQNYVMVKILERQTKLQWKVDIPKHAYNIPFWLIFKPELRVSDESGQRKIRGPLENLVGQTPNPPQEVQARMSVSE